MSPDSSSTSSTGNEQAVRAILDRTLSGLESLGSGSGRLNSDFGNTLATTPATVVGVTFAFICTGGGTVTLRVAVEGNYRQAAPVVRGCDGSVAQQSIDLAKPSMVGFEASSTGSTDGFFAYGYYIEKKQ